MKTLSQKEKVDLLIDQFWQNGFLTTSRKYGKYLPEPRPLGRYEVDAMGKLKKNLAIAITLNKEEIDLPETKRKIQYLVSKYSKNSTRTVFLFVGAPSNMLFKAKMMISELSPEISKNIRLVAIPGND